MYFLFLQKLCSLHFINLCVVKKLFPRRLVCLSSLMDGPVLVRGERARPRGIIGGISSLFSLALFTPATQPQHYIQNINLGFKTQNDFGVIFRTYHIYMRAETISSTQNETMF